MVRAILENRKTMTRRIVKPQPSMPFGGVFSDARKWWTGDSLTGEVIEALRVPYAVGDLLWVREHWRTEARYDGVSPRDLSKGALVSHEADYDNEPNDGCRGRLRPSIHMPRWASRITLEVTAVRVQQLQDIRDEDAQAEGCIHHHDPAGDGQNIIEQFSYLWTSIHGPGSWEANPWVAAITFSRVK